jgi:Rrf2 family protein
MILFSQSPKGMLTLPEISSKEGLSLPYVGKLLMKLKKAGLVKAVRGRNGGFILSRPADEIYLKEVLAALGNTLYGSHHCDRYSVDEESCRHQGDCKVGTLWGYFNQYIQSAIEKVTLADIAAGNLNFLKPVNFQT